MDHLTREPSRIRSRVGVILKGPPVRGDAQVSSPRRRCTRLGVRDGTAARRCGS